MLYIRGRLCITKCNDRSEAGGREGRGGEGREGKGRREVISQAVPDDLYFIRSLTPFRIYMINLHFLPLPPILQWATKVLRHFVIKLNF